MIEPLAQRFNNCGRCLEVHIRDTGGKQILRTVSQHHGVNFQCRHKTPIDLISNDIGSPVSLNCFLLGDREQIQCYPSALRGFFVSSSSFWIAGNSDTCRYLKYSSR